MREPSPVDEFLAVAARAPDRPALVHDGQSITYGELRARARAVAAALGDRPGIVGVPATRTPDTIATLLGVWLAGGAYCPLDPAFPAERLAAMRAVCDRVPDGPVPAYVLFTSGSTGAPKPVATPVRAIATVTAALRDLFGITSADRVLQFASLNWDTCFEEILPALTSGATLVLDADAHTGSFARFLRVVEREQVTVLDLPTAFWHELVHHLTEGAEDLPACVRLVITGGEAVRPERLADWLVLGTEARLLNTYGCTETTLITHACELAMPYERVPIGYPLPHVVEYVDDGELLIGGPALAIGYLGLPDKTGERFTERAGTRVFRTGDRVSRRPDGMLVHEGRLDGEVKIRGIRVDPAEVEAHLVRHPDVVEAAVAGVRTANHTSLAAYVVVRDGDVEPASILTELRTRVPGHLVPSRLTVVPELVRTASGKVDRAGTHAAGSLVMEGKR
ncbi:MAG: amino acid adenylation domain-containing protein [Actinophytocola sp.]|uniref:amino acid adenylation domain-containing protein n=1 Tax=Actinophytocola sp. TaxID=1872138 RepID=UPI003C7759AE